jgi:hypothetical protein
MMATNKNRVRNVKTVSTFPPEGLFTKDAETIAQVMATKKVGPRGIASGIPVLQFFINRAGRGLPPVRKRQREKAKRILQERLRREKSRSGSKRSPVKASGAQA